MTLAELISPDAPAVITVEQAADILFIGRGTAYEAVRQGQLPSLKLGRRVLIPTRRLLALLGAEADTGSVEPGH